MPLKNLTPHQTALQLALCQRDYELMAEHHPNILEEIEAALSAGASPTLIKRWALATVQEPALVQRVFNAAKFTQSLEGAPQ